MARNPSGTRIRQKCQRGSIPRPSAIEFILSPEGRKAFREGLKAIDESERELAEARRVTWHDLHEPLTPNIGR